ncbi:phosphotransferase [Streptomyces sp. NPDC101165]|uniref:phosphotransferase n=1 Tax=Streptomyces sp. NPDC101165 TaxID=3366119 RepID=UPI003814264F
MTDAKLLPSDLRAWAQRQVGPITAVRDVSHPRPGSRVWELRLGGRPGVFVKVASGVVAYQRESLAYRHAVPALGPEAAPQLIESSARHLGPLLTAVPGRPLAGLDVSRAERYEAYRQGGVLLDRLHAAGDMRGEHRVGAEEALRRAAHGVEKHLAAASDRVSAAARRFVRRLAGDLLLLGPLPLRFLHGDAWERNLIWSGRTSWVDFERAASGPVSRTSFPLAVLALSLVRSLRALPVTAPTPDGKPTTPANVPALAEPGAPHQQEGDKL